MIDYLIKPKKADDIYQLYLALGWNDYLKLKRDDIIKAMEGSHYVIYAYDKDSLVGTGRIVSDGVINAYLCGLGVLEKYRNLGIGTTITEKLVDYCFNRNLHVQFFCTEDLVSFYKKRGYSKFAIGMKKEHN